MEPTNPEAAAGSSAAPSASWLEQYYTPEKGGGDAADEAVPALSRGAPGKYTILEPLAEGGMKSILRARDTDTGRVVALARIRGEPGARAVRRFIYEARLVAGLQHPSIVPIHDLGVDAEGRPFFTMRLVAGESLADILKKLRAGLPGYAAAHPRAKLLSVFNRVCDAVAFAHARGVLHLDLKPSNIHVGKFGEVLVLDWGLAKLMDGGTRPSPPAAIWPRSKAIARPRCTARSKGRPASWRPNRLPATPRRRMSAPTSMRSVACCTLS
jgi:serine/threonine protein kinase